MKHIIDEKNQKPGNFFKMKTTEYAERLAGGGASSFSRLAVPSDKYN